MSRLSRETQELLERGRGGSALAPAHKARLRRDVLAKAAGASVLLTASSAAGLTSVATKVVGAVAIVVATGTGVALATHAASAVRARTGRSEAAESARVDSPRRPPSSPPPAVQNRSAGMVASAAPAAPPAVIPPVVVEAAPPSASVLSSLAVAPPVAKAPAGRREHASVAAAAGAPAVAAVPARQVPAETVSASTLEREATLLRDADRSLKNGDAVHALTLLDAHAASFPQSALEPERSAERVFALCAAGRTTEAKGEARAFLQSHPSGPLAAGVRGSCGADK